MFVAYLMMRAVVEFMQENPGRCIAFAGLGVSVAALTYHYFG